MLNEPQDYRDWKVRSDRIDGVFIKLTDGNGNFWYLGNFEANEVTDGSNTVHIFDAITDSVDIDLEINDIDNTWSRVVVDLTLDNAEGVIDDDASTGLPVRLSDVLADVTAESAQIYFNVMPNVSNINQCLQRFNGFVRIINGYDQESFKLELAVNDSFLDESPLKYTPNDIYVDRAKSDPRGTKTFSMDDESRESKIGLAYGLFSRIDAFHGLCRVLQYQRENNEVKYVAAAHSILAGAGDDYMELFVPSDGGKKPLLVVTNVSFDEGIQEDEIFDEGEFPAGYPQFASVRMRSTHSFLLDGVYYEGYIVEEPFTIIGLSKTLTGEFANSPFSDYFLTIPPEDWWREAIEPQLGRDNNPATVTSIPNIVNEWNGSFYEIGGHASWDLEKPTRFSSRFHIPGATTFVRWESCTFLHSMPDQNDFRMIYMEDYVNGGGGAFPGYFSFSDGFTAGDGESTARGAGFTNYVPDRAYALEYTSFNESSVASVPIDDPVIDVGEISLILHYPYYPGLGEDDKSGVKTGFGWLGLTGRKYGSWADDALWSLPYTEGDLIEDPAMIIASLFLDELINPITGVAFVVADLNYESFENAVSDIIARINITDESMSYRDIIEQLTSQMLSTFVLDSFGKPTLISLRFQSTVPTLNTTPIRWDQMDKIPEFKKVNWEDIVTVLNTKSRFLPEESNRYMDIETFTNATAVSKYGDTNSLDISFENIDGDNVTSIAKHLIHHTGDNDGGLLSKERIEIPLDISGQLYTAVEIGDIITLDAETWDTHLKLFGASHAGMLYMVLGYRHSETESILQVKEAPVTSLDNL